MGPEGSGGVSEYIGTSLSASHADLPPLSLHYHFGPPPPRPPRERTLRKYYLSLSHSPPAPPGSALYASTTSQGAHAAQVLPLTLPLSPRPPRERTLRKYYL